MTGVTLANNVPVDVGPACRFPSSCYTAQRSQPHPREVQFTGERPFNTIHATTDVPGLT